MMSTGLHCRLAGRRRRRAVIARFLDHAGRREAIRFARLIDIARHWREAHPPRAYRGDHAP